MKLYIGVENENILKKPNFMPDEHVQKPDFYLSWTAMIFDNNYLISEFKAVNEVFMIHITYTWIRSAFRY